MCLWCPTSHALAWWLRLQISGSKLGLSNTGRATGSCQHSSLCLIGTLMLLVIAGWHYAVLCGMHSLCWPDRWWVVHMPYGLIKSQCACLRGVSYVVLLLVVLVIALVAGLHVQWEIKGSVMEQIAWGVPPPPTGRWGPLAVKIGHHEAAVKSLHCL